MARSKKSTKKRVDWSDRQHLDMLIDQRAFMRNDDQVALLAKLIGLRPGKKIADIGCGLGYLGHIFSRFIIPKGKYLGIDHNRKLLNMARKESANRRLAGVFRFIQGCATSIPLEDECVDAAMCQTLLIHLKDPEFAVREMIRVTKNHGRVVAFEPNNIAWELLSWGNLKEESLKRKIENLEFSCRIFEGREKLGLGDNRIGEKVPYLFMKNGLKNIEVRLNDKIYALVPPYDTPELEHRSRMFLKRVRKDLRRTRAEKRKDYLEWKKWYIAGGGDAETYRRVVRRSRRWWKENYSRIARMIRKEELYHVATSPFYIVIGEK